ncbi:hypothetical protein A7K94_0214635, partial [Modestobacter sp. VKM Ac-2676]
VGHRRGRRPRRRLLGRGGGDARPGHRASYGEEALLRLCLASLQRYPAFVAELEQASGLPVELRTVGTLVVGFDADDVRQLDELHAFQTELGLDAERLTPREARRREPALTPRVRGGLAVSGDTPWTGARCTLPCWPPAPPPGCSWCGTGRRGSASRRAGPPASRWPAAGS